ncbi:extra-large GTP-binding protein 2 [Artemisia annua]|uniref:Extra-large GTP-binding protein 2 n=1 Tax=Artemisia annua TaxID=35608 RepID=A0A2U1Q8B3_ARTAN|nr:extra-large GTP-binding protein 2 [Artemisia annua]
MGSLLRSILPISIPKKDDDDEYNVEYSFATEYTGPPVSYNIPKALPIDVGCISTASIVSTPVNSGNLSLPVIYPVLKREPKPFSGLIVPEANSPCSPVGEGSTASLGFSDSQENSSLSSDKDCHEIEEFSASEEDQAHHDISDYENRTQAVTFREPESSTTDQEETRYSHEPMYQERPHADPNIKKGLCHRCLKGNRFTLKESCIVCDAKYCSKCVLRVMGAMPEGRKCITCIGYPINELKRRRLGRCSKVLKTLLTDNRVKQVMTFEKSCLVNQAPYSLIFVNGQPLTFDEVLLLQTCAYPPKRLVPGSYWYDKMSGLWGKEGHKPCQVISPSLIVGGSIMENASNGNTKVKINGRVISKAELLMLKFAGINCKGCPHFWVSHDGSCQEEGQNQMKGKIWEKPGIETICAFLSLPVPPKSFISSEEEVVNNGSQIVSKKVDVKSLTKILLVGQDQSGTSAIYKQAKILYKVPFLDDERQKIKSLIQSNLYLYISILLEGLKQFEEDYSIQIRKKLADQPSTSAAGGSVKNIEKNIYSLSTELQSFSDSLLQVVKSGNLEVVFPDVSYEYSGLVEKLWKDEGFLATYARRDELSTLPMVAEYFLSRAIEISSMTYEPSDEDILYADGITSSNGLASMEYSVPSSPPVTFMDATEQNDAPLQRYQLIRVNAGNLGNNCKWLDMFEDVDLILYCVDLTSYNEFHVDNNMNLINKMLESKNIFENIITHPSFINKQFLLILNKFDLLEKQIITTPLTQCDWFHDFNPFITSYTYNNGSSDNNKNNSSVAQYGFQYIAAKFKKLFSDLTGRKLYVSSVIGLEADSVDAALRYGNDVLTWIDEENKHISGNNEYSFESSETSL